LAELQGKENVYLVLESECVLILVEELLRVGDKKVEKE
jgi:hypothetical protein